jgi:hypothetical protein
MVTGIFGSTTKFYIKTVLVSRIVAVCAQIVTAFFLQLLSSFFINQEPFHDAIICFKFPFIVLVLISI